MKMNRVQLLLFLAVISLIVGEYDKVTVPMNQEKKKQYPYSLFNNELNVFVKVNDKGCFYFHFISYSLFYFNNSKDETSNESLECNGEDQVEIKMKNGITLKILNLTHSELIKAFWLEGNNDSSKKEEKEEVYLEFKEDERDNTVYNFSIIRNFTRIGNGKLSKKFFQFEHFLFKNLFVELSSLFGYSCILIGLFISTFGSLFHKLTAGLLAIFFLIGFVNELIEPFLLNSMFNLSLALLITIAAALLGIFLGWLIVLKKSIMKIFYGSMLGFVLFKIISFCYLLISSKGFSGENILIYFLWIVFSALFGYLYYEIRNNQLSFIVSTSIVGSFICVYGYNLLLGGYLEDTLVFKIREYSRKLSEPTIFNVFFEKWKTQYVLMYFCVWVVASIVFFLIQLTLRYRREMEKPKESQRGLFRSTRAKTSFVKINPSETFNNFDRSGKSDSKKQEEEEQMKEKENENEKEEEEEEIEEESEDKNEETVENN